MNSEVILNDDNNEVQRFFEQVYNSENTHFVITPRIAQILYNKINDNYLGVSYELSIDNKELCQFLRTDNIISFIQNRQPELSKVPEDVMHNISDYFDKEIKQYIPLYVCRHSNHPNDDYLYSVIGRNTSDDSYACWSTFNNSTKVLNHGHYGLSNFEEAMNVVRDKFFDITENIDKYGPEQTLIELSANKAVENESSNIIRKRTR